jgi:hypothetical protein
MKENEEREGEAKMNVGSTDESSGDFKSIMAAAQGGVAPNSGRSKSE